MIVALCRYAGLRCPSELLELRAVLADCYADAEELVPGLTNGAVNLRTEFSRVVVRARLSMWEKPFQNLRSSYETDWFRQYPGRINDVARWMGHSPEIAMRHYLQVIPQGVDDATAAETGEPVRRPTSRSGARQSGAVAQNPAQQRTARDGMARQAPEAEMRVPREKRGSPPIVQPEGSQRVGATPDVTSCTTWPSSEKPAEMAGLCPYPFPYQIWFDGDAVRARTAKGLYRRGH